MKTEEEYQEALELDDDQRKAFVSLQKAFNRCRNVDILFYQNLDTLGALNGRNVICVDEGGTREAPNCVNDKLFPTIESECSFADDAHYVILHRE